MQKTKDNQPRELSPDKRVKALESHAFHLLGMLNKQSSLHNIVLLQGHNIFKETYTKPKNKLTKN